MKHIYLIRHGRQDARDCNVNVELSKEGRAQASLLSERLATWHFDKMYSSVLIRAVETSDIINEHHHMDIERRPELNEIDWGDLTGMTIPDMYAEYDEFLKRRSRHDEDLRFPGGENCEDVCRRAVPVFREIERSDYESILIVTHGGAIRSLIAGLLGLKYSDYLAFGKVLENTSITELGYNEELGIYTLERLNDYAHLDGHPELCRGAWSIYSKKK